MAAPETETQISSGHMTPCACHCAACGAVGYRGGLCVVLRARLLELFGGKADVVDLIVKHYHASCGWGEVRPLRFDVGTRYECFDVGTRICCVRYGPGGVFVAAGGDGRYDYGCDGKDGNIIHVICAWTGRALWTVKGHSKDNAACTCQHTDPKWGFPAYNADPQCPVKGHTR